MNKKLCLTVCLSVPALLCGMQQGINLAAVGTAQSNVVTLESVRSGNSTVEPKSKSSDEQRQELRDLTSKFLLAPFPKTDEQARINTQLGTAIDFTQSKSAVYRAIVMAAAKKRAEIAARGAVGVDSGTSVDESQSAVDTVALQQRITTEEQRAAERRQAAQQRSENELESVRKELAEAYAQFALLGQQYGDETEAHAREIAVARAKISALETKCKQQQGTIKELIASAEDQINRARESK